MPAFLVKKRLRDSIVLTSLASQGWATRGYAAESITRFGDTASLTGPEQTLHGEPERAVHANATCAPHSSFAGNFMRPFALRLLLWSAASLIVPPGASLVAQATGTLGEPLALEVATSLRDHNGRSPLNLSPDGQWVAHTIRAIETVPRDSIGRRYSATGFSFAEGDWRMEATLSSTTTDEVVRLGGETSASWAPVWSPDGSRVAFYSDEGGTAGLWIWERSMRRATRVPGLIVRPRFGFETVQWASDSRRLLVKVLPEGMTVAQANAREGPGATAVSAPPAASPDEASVIVRRFDPRPSAREPARPPGSEATAAPAPPPQWVEVDLVVVDLGDGSVRRLVESAPVRAYAFSPDERYVAYTVSTSGEPNSQQPRFNLVVEELASAERRTLATSTWLGYGVEFSWSPNSRMLAQITSGQLAAGEIVLYDVATGAARSLASEELPSFDPGEGEYPPLWDAQSKHLYAVGGGALWRVDAASGRGRAVGRLDGWRIRSAVWNHGSSTIWTTDRGRTAWVIAGMPGGGDAAILAVDLTGERATVALREPKGYGAVFNLAASDARREIAFVSSGQRDLSEIWMLDTRTSRVRRASNINPDLNRLPLGDAQIIAWQTADGDTLRGALLLPPGWEPGTRVPLVVYVYGDNRGSAYVNRFGLVGNLANLNLHILATRGYAVLYPDAPLREGMAVADLMRAVMPGVDAAIAQGFADADRLAIMGQSYGSYNTLAIITQTTRFKAAVLTAAVLHPDLFTDYLRNIGFYERGSGKMGGSIWEHHERYLVNSPLFHFDKIETPVLIGQGERDGDLVASAAIFTALERLQKSVEYRVYAGEGHVLTQGPNVVDFWNRRLEFLAEHLDLVTDSRGAVLFENGRPQGRLAPRIDYHQHLVSPAFAPIVRLPERDGAALIRELDAAGIERAVVLSVGYSYGDERKALEDPDRLTREENDWTSTQVTTHAPRLIGFCAANPLRPGALEELERCLGLPGMVGIKLHLGNAGITLRDPAHLARIQQLFDMAQRQRAPVLMHMRARGGTNYGAEDAQIFLDAVVPRAPDIEIILAHLGASSPGYSMQNDEVMAVFAAAAERGDPRMGNLYFDVAANVTEESRVSADLIAQRIRQIGPSRILYGSDLSPPGGSIRQGWEIFRTRVPLTAAELEEIANNRARFARGGTQRRPER